MQGVGRPSAFALFLALLTRHSLALPSSYEPVKTDPSERWLLVNMYQSCEGATWKNGWPISDPNNDPCLDRYGDLYAIKSLNINLNSQK